MLVTEIIQTVITAILAVVLVGVFVLYKKPKFSRMVSGLSVLVAALVFASALLIVAFLEKPQFTVLGSSETVIPVFFEYIDPGATATFHNKDLSDRIKVTGTVDTSKIGEYNIEYDFSLRGHYYYAVRKVVVTDTTAPELTLVGDRNITVSSFDFYKEAGFTAKDNYDGDITANVQTITEKVRENKYRITYTAADSSGNRAADYREIEVKDIIKPVISLSTETFLQVPQGAEFNYPTAEAADDLDGDISNKITLSGSVDTAVAGVQNLSYAVTDNAGNTATKRVQVNVYVPDDPTLSRIYLTFDDGPSDNVTPRVLDILKENGIKATFFINGYSDDKLPIINRIIAEGHTVGIHGTSHDYAAIYTSADASVNNINSLQDKLLADTGYRATVMRFPGGSSNQVSKQYCTGVVTASVGTLTAQGWRYFDWNVDSDDAGGSRSSSYIINQVKSQLKKGRANIVLMHDYFNKSTSADALQSIIDYGKANGYIFEAINVTTPDVHHNIAN